MRLLPALARNPWAALLAAAFLLATTVGCSTLSVVTGQVHMDLDERVVHDVAVSVGDLLDLEMRNPGSGGYDFAGASFDPAILTLERNYLVPAQEPKAGDFGRAVYVFKAIAPGKTDVIIKIHRPWEKNTLPEIYKTVHVDVQ